MEDVSNADRMVLKFSIPGRRNILITSALPYVNKVPQLGNIIGCVLSADVFARYIRLGGYNAIYICGTDEYGTTTETKAIKEKCSPKEICDEYGAIHREVYKSFDISSDEFGPTSIPQQTEVCQAILKKPLENNWLSENTMQLLFCDTCKSFLADHVVKGSCPTPGCDYDIACGYQCEKCGKILNPTELKDPRCKVICPDTLLGTGEDWIVMRTISVMEYLKYEAGQGYDYTIPDAPHDISDPLTENLAEKVGKYVEQYVEAMEKVELPQGLEIAMCISSEGNAYLQESQFWKLFEEDKPCCAIVMKTSLGLVHILACLLEPFMPSFSHEVLKQLNLPPGQLSLADEKGYVDGAKRPWLIVSSGHGIGKPELLFEELKDEVESFRKRFAGSQEALYVEEIDGSKRPAVDDLLSSSLSLVGSDASTSSGDDSSEDDEAEWVNEKTDYIKEKNGDRIRQTWYKCSQDGCPVRKIRFTVDKADALSRKSKKSFRGTHEH